MRQIESEINYTCNKNVSLQMLDTNNKNKKKNLDNLDLFNFNGMSYIDLVITHCTLQLYACFKMALFSAGSVETQKWEK